MKQIINLHQFREAFQAIRPDNFSYEGLEVLYNFFDQWDQDMETETGLDVIAICCEFNESTRGEIISDYCLDEFRQELGPFPDWRLKGDREESELLEYLNDRTLVAGQTDSTIIYVAF